MRGRVAATMGAACALAACDGRGPAGPPGTTSGATLAASTTLTCARSGDGACCWGETADGVSLPVPTAVPLPGVPSDIAVLGSTACALVSGRVNCWSFSSDGQPSVAELTGAGAAVQISANDQHACALHADGTVACWGDDGFGQLGDGRVSQGLLPPAAVSMLANVVEIAAGEWHTCARLGSGAVSCWGMGYGSASCGGYTCSATPVAVPLPAPAVHLSAGGIATCAMTADGTVYCWEVMNGVASAPAAVPSLAGAESVQPGYALGCAIPGDHRPICWGGLGHATRTVMVDHAPIAGFEGIVEYASGWYHACGRTEAGGVVCLGANDSHQLGDGTAVDAAAPRPTLGCPTP